MTDISTSRLFSAPKIGLFGLGSSNRALLSLLCERGLQDRAVLRSEEKIPKELIPFGVRAVYEKERAFDNLTEDLLVLSPSVRRERAELSPIFKEGKTTSDCELFFELCTLPTFAVTGSDGKSTTATLAAKMLEKCRSGVKLIGNIGVPMLPALPYGETFVTELSSFNLHYLNAGFTRAAVTNITPNHLNFHKDMKEYADAKLSALSRAREPVVFSDGDILSEYAERKPVYAVASVNESFDAARKKYRAEIFLTLEDGILKRCGEPLFDISHLKNQNKNYIKNLMTAAALSDGFADREVILSVAEDFTGLSHRCELFLSAGGVDFIDSSIDTTPARCISSVVGIEKPVVLLLGGRGKGVSYAPLGAALKDRVRLAILFGEDGEKIATALDGKIPYLTEYDFTAAVLKALSLVNSGEALVLSPAATSYDSFRSFEERGDLFKKIIKESRT